MYKISETEFKGKPILVIRDEEGKRILFSAGVNKIRVIIENFEELRKFMKEKNGG